MMEMSFFFENFVMIWALVGVLLLTLVYLSQTRGSKIYTYVSMLLITLTVMYSITRENDIRFYETAGKPKEESVYIHHTIDQGKDEELIIRVWIKDKKRQSTRVYVFPYTREDEKLLERAKEETRSGSTFLIRDTTNSPLNDGDSKYSLEGKVQVNVRKFPRKSAD